MATKKQLEAKLKKLEARLNAQVKGQSNPDIVQTAKEWIKTNLKANVTLEEKNTYKVASGEVKQGTLLKLDNGKSFQVGTARFWVLK